MPRVSTVEEVLAAARYKKAQKDAQQSQGSALGVPTLPGLGYVAAVSGVVSAAVEWTFVAATYQPAPDEVWALIMDQAAVTELDRKHRESNMDPARAGLPKLPVYSAETPYAIVRTVG